MRTGALSGSPCPRRPLGPAVDMPTGRQECSGAQGAEPASGRSQQQGSACDSTWSLPALGWAGPAGQSDGGTWGSENEDKRDVAVLVVGISDLSKRHLDDHFLKQLDKLYNAKPSDGPCVRRKHGSR